MVADIFTQPSHHKKASTALSSNITKTIFNYNLMTVTDNEYGFPLNINVFELNLCLLS